MARQNANGEKNMDGVEKAAILLIALGPEKSAQIFKHLKEDEIEQLTLEIANTSSVSPQTKEQVLNDFYEVCLAQQYIAEGGIGYAKELLEKSLGEEKAKAVIGNLQQAFRYVHSNLSEEQILHSCSTLYRMSIHRLLLLYYHTFHLHRHRQLYHLCHLKSRQMLQGE